MSEAGTVVVIDQTGRHHHFDADDFENGVGGSVEVMKDGKRVASFPLGYIGAYKVSARAEAPVMVVGSGGGGGAA